jgi:hypothetical protein
METEFVEELARSMHRQYGKEMFGEARNWEKSVANERSVWRLLVRTVLTRAKEKPASPATLVAARMARPDSNRTSRQASRR